MQKLRQASLMEQTGEDDGGLAGPQRSQCWHTLCHTAGGTAGLTWAPGMFNSCSHGTQVVEVVSSATEMIF